MVVTYKNRPRKIAFVIGGASCVWHDWNRARFLCVPDVSVLINDMGVDYPGAVDLWVSYHQNLLAEWIKKRKKLGLPDATKHFVGPGRCRKGVPGAKVIKVHGGSSGLLATYAALKEHATHVILTGVPLDTQQGHVLGKYKGEGWPDGKNYQGHWKRDFKALRGKVRSMSGFTRDLLGEPTLDWLGAFHD
jgi:hypothetical protein